ncbi:PspC domain-containing protein [Muricauda brasiliensis]|uniref:PspC domain-containing protein n=1 Tax=Muricauda brasiliensis TaxID=2162892 RepID=UPI000D3DC771|nr:PspC domain-containing protein [Muricauda brasiliensis]
MNKTVNINLANTLFHIDDDAYNKLRRYLESIKRSFSGTKGSDEIIADIEARIAELFLEKMENERQVITHKEVDQVIDVMGQPEDYMVDEDIFEDEPKRSYAEPTPGKAKKLYRDIDHKYIGGVCAGLEHYLGIDALWVRLIFILLAVFTSGFGLIAYILLWILVPEAITTSQKLDMRGEPVNISNIERKVKEGFDDVADKVKSVDYEKVGNRVKSSSKTFFDTIGDIILFLFKLFGKFIGIILVLVGAANLIALFIAIVTLGAFDASNFPIIDLYNTIIEAGIIPVWATLLFGFFAFGIPFFFVMYLGLKILVTNLKSIGNIAKFSLLGLWLISIGALIALGVKQAAEFSYTGSVNQNEEVNFTVPSDTLIITMKDADMDYDRDDIHFGRMTFGYDENDDRILMSDEIDIKIRKSDTDSISINIRKDADGSSTPAARDRARNIEYAYTVDGNEIVLDKYLTTEISNKARNQEVTVTIYVPESMTVHFDDNTSRYIGRGIDNDQGFYRSGMAGQHWLMNNDGELQCLDCPEDDTDDDDSDGNGRIIINEDGIDINIQDAEDSVQLKIDENGVNVKAKEKSNN